MKYNNINIINIMYMLTQYMETHPNLSKLWLHKLISDPSSENITQAYQTLIYLKDVPDFSKFEILTINIVSNIY